MKDYSDLVESLKCSFASSAVSIEAADAIVILTNELRTCRNELCYKCGDYKNAHNGACDDCRWRH